ncbi:MAG: spermidine synthase [Stackebrandtia sp.]
MPNPSTPQVVARHADGPHGELVLRKVDDDYEIISNGVFLMDTRNGESERLLISAALDRLYGSDLAVLVGGLGVGFSLVEALASPRVGAVTVVERLPAIIDWHHGLLRGVSGGAVDDPRLAMIPDDLVAWLYATDQRYDAVCLDIDNGPHWTVVPENDRLYGEQSTRRLAEIVRPGGVLTVWGAEDSPEYRKRLAWHFGEAITLKVEVPRGQPDVVFVAQRL